MWQTIRDVFSHFGTRKRFWLLPLVLFLLLLGALIVIGAKSAFAPFIYTLF